MAETPTQTKANHARLDPKFHFVLLPILMLLFLWSIVHLIRHPGTESVVLPILIAMVLLGVFTARVYALKVQDRVIRLEERLRMATLLPHTAQTQAALLTESQLIALRFAPDAELPALVERAARERLSGKQIKESIQNWRPDYWRV